ncbi:MAG: vWA domain-containing protein, partial [Tepidiformaceae bacterium]
CDVSGSMDVYSGQLLQFLYALQAESGGVHTFVFSTRLHDVTHILRRKQYEEALSGLAAAVQSWSGGTTIGQCIGEFNMRYGARLLTPRTVVLVVCDGWERGEPERLAREMAVLKRRAYRVIWLNPLKGHDGYEPLARGMAAALPYVDHFLAGNSIQSLERLKRTLAGL